MKNKQHLKILIAQFVHVIRSLPRFYQRLFTIEIKLLTTGGLVGDLVPKFLEGMPQKDPKRVSITREVQYDNLY